MFRYLAVASLVAAPLALAQSSNPLIPSGISSGCSTFLQSFNTNAAVATCLSALNKATEAFAPGESTPSAQVVNTALTDLCSDSTTNACPEAAIRSQLTELWSQCQSDFTGTPNKDLLQIYDVLYTLLPFKSSLCSKDDSGNSCALAPSTATREDSSEDSPSLSELLATLWTSNNGALKRRAPVDAITPNITTFVDLNLPFLFIDSNSDATTLCTACTRNVVSAYLSFSSNTPYGPGFANGILLKAQPTILAAINDKCPANFLGNAIDAAGGIGTSGNPFGGASSLSVERGTLLAFVLSVATLAAL